MIAKALDSIVSAFSPERGLKRAAARKRLSRGFSGAESNRLTASMNPKNQPADQELIGPNGASKMRAWARMLVRDNAYASGVVDTIVASVIGTGIGVQSMLETQDGEDVEDINERRDAIWAEWCEVCELTGQYNFDEVQAIVLREMVEAGEVLIHFVTVPQEFHGIKRKIPLALELIEADRLAEDRDTHPISRRIGKRIVRGVELNEIGVPVAYWIYPVHPNDPTTLRLEPVRIESQNILHLYRRDRVGQTRGVSWFAPVVSWMRNLGIFVENEMQAGAIGSCLTAFITSETPIDSIAPSADQETTDDNGNTYDYLEPGMIARLRPGESVQHVTPQRPNSNAEPWIALMLRGIAVGTGLSYEIVARDFSQTNYSSNRASQLEDRRRFRRWQRYLCDNLLQPVWDRFCGAATLSRHMSVQFAFPSADQLNADPRRFAPAEFRTPVWEWVDPVSDQQSSQNAIAANQTTMARESGGNGSNWRHDYYQRAKEEKLRKKLGLWAPWGNEQAAAVPGVEGAAVAETALNGAQVTSLVDVIAQVASGMLPKESAKAILSSAFPAFDDAKIASIVDPVVPGSVTPDGAGIAPASGTDASPGGEMAALSTLQFKRNRKAIETILGELSAGTTTEAKAKVYLSSIGLTTATIDALIADALDGSGKLESVDKPESTEAAP